MKNKPDYLRLEFKTMSYLGMDFPEQKFVRFFDAEIKGYIVDEEKDIENDNLKIGTINGYIIDGGNALNCGQSIYALMDANSQSTCDILEDLIFPYKNKEGDFGIIPDKIWESISLEPPFNANDCLYLNQMKIFKKYRGNDFGLHIMKTAMETMGMGCGSTIIKPYPLQYNGCVTKENEAEFNLATIKLITYYSRLGFRKIPHTPYMIFNHDYEILIKEKEEMREVYMR